MESLDLEQKYLDHVRHEIKTKVLKFELSQSDEK